MIVGTFLIDDIENLRNRIHIIMHRFITIN